jgi:hypothetical protein
MPGRRFQNRLRPRFLVRIQGNQVLDLDRRRQHEIVNRDWSRVFVLLGVYRHSFVHLNARRSRTEGIDRSWHLMHDLRIQNRDKIANRTRRADDGGLFERRLRPWPSVRLEPGGSRRRLAAGLGRLDVLGFHVLNFEHLATNRIRAAHALTAQARIELVAATATGAIGSDVHELTLIG